LTRQRCQEGTRLALKGIELAREGIAMFDLHIDLLYVSA